MKNLVFVAAALAGFPARWCRRAPRSVRYALYIDAFTFAIM